MKTFFRKYIFATAGVLLLLFSGSGTSTSTIKNPMELYLLVGQSNMAGRGKVEAIDTVRIRRYMCSMQTMNGASPKNHCTMTKPIEG